MQKKEIVFEIFYVPWVYVGFCSGIKYLFTRFLSILDILN